MKKAQIRKLRQTVKNRQKKPGFFGYVISKLKTYLFTGILVTMPVTITFYMAYELFVWMDKWTRSLIPPQVPRSGWMTSMERSSKKGTYPQRL